MAAKLHWIRIDSKEYLTIEERLELAKEIEVGLKAMDRPNDRVMVLSEMTWLGSEEI